MSENALALRQSQEMLTAKLFAESGFFPDAKSMAQAFVKIQTGRELGVSPMAAMTGIAIIQGKPVVGANIIAAKVKSSGYNYLIKRLDEKGCVIEFFDRAGKPIGKSSFDEADARTAGLLGKDNWKKYARNMYFARAIANGQKWFCPDATMGQTVYTPDELGGEVDEEGNPVIKEAEYEIEGDPPPPPPPPQAEEKSDADKLRDVLNLLSEKTEATFAELLKEYSIFGEKGKEKWITDIDKASVKWIRTTYGKAKDALGELQSLSDVIDSAMEVTVPSDKDAGSLFESDYPG